MTEPALKLEQVEKTFDRVRAVDKVSLDVGQSEFFSLLGPSGSGKTTLLRIIAGLETPGNGTIHIGGRRHPASALCPRHRNGVSGFSAISP
jgi:ABC-type Fe3+/spermidine/putrescine transport system ATPase subunit